jgi:CelD/BcsL family acetyltransferase involved in cellulose biosynthesis
MMKVSVVLPHELGASELSAWRAMQRSTPGLAGAFLSPGFALAAGRVRRRARVAVLEEGQEVMGFFPFEQGPFRVGRPIAAGACDAQGVIHAPGLEWDAGELLRGCGLDVWEFDHLVADQLASAGRNVVRRSSPIIDLSRGYEAYVEERRRSSKKTFKSTLYKQRKLERDLGGSRFELEVRDPEALTVLMRWKSGQYRRTGRRDRFAIDWIERLVRDLFETRSDGCVGTLSVLYAAERPVAAHFGLRSDSSLSCWFPAYDPALARYSPGLSLHLRMAEAAAAAGVRCLDLGKGDEDYKQSLKTGELSVGEGWIDRPSAVAMVRRVQRTPRRLAFNLVSRRPGLRRAARGALKRVASLRSSM